MTLILYASKHGTVAKLAQELADRLSDECTLVDIKHQKVPSLAPYSAVILGFSVHAGHVQKAITGFAKQHISELKDKHLGLFCSCLSEESLSIDYIHKNFTPETIESVLSIGLFGGGVYFEKMNVIERFIMKKITKKDRSYSTVDLKSVDEFVRLFEQNSTQG
ncbi:MAG: flavodoxin domain-containing protein [Spirochaetia bacterium]|nr:flavodoxin domain-containing protein [Spirochaetia bacterium]MCF7942223.1 flavodoxin domain-containing protein [Spirochaetia bacterium]